MKIGNYIYEERNGEYFVTKEKTSLNKKIFERRGVPKKYIDSSFSDFFNLSPIYKEEIEKVKIYLDKKLYKNGNGLYIYGPINSGKTFLTSLIAKELLNNELIGHFYTFAEMIDLFSTEWSNFSQELKSYQFLCIDNFEDILKEDSYFLNKIKDLFNYFDLNKKVLIINSKKNLSDFYETPLKVIVPILQRNTLLIHLPNSFEGSNNVQI